MPKKKKISLTDIKIKSYSTLLNEEEVKQINGGYITPGKPGRVVARWTSMDTRSVNRNTDADPYIDPFQEQKKKLF